MSSETEPYYLSRGDGRYESTIHAQGAWNPHEQHMAPVAGLLAHCLERFQPRPELRIARISFDILGLIPGGEFEVVTTLLRPGRTIELVQAEMVADGRTAVRATAWRLQRSDTSAVAAIEDERMPGPDAAEPVGMSEWPGGFIQSIEARALPAHAPGRGRGWIRTRHPLLQGEEFSDFARLAGLIDTSNGIAPRVMPGPGGYAFPNVDLQLHLYREPTGEWLGLQNSVSFGTDGIGLTSTVLHDTSGPFGRAEQILTLRTLG
ncbi:thioesterase superfamily protein [Homoserinimonas aerilata]|uniref:Thioesterase superfamily protein n=1 Tax=Homoserinimonas aerilata TaxID=1162970 RepID=A0A542YJI7_9MICO|nr:thioesterase family protein [Homoserinimonas aerilata]TQL48201.1 thioesterase superfamily protein [Homoserinimonas aerilata]